MSLNSVTEDIALLLENGSKGTRAVDIFAFQWGTNDDGSELDRQIFILDTSNIEAEVKDEYENPTFRISVRGKKDESMTSVYDRGRDIYEFILQQPRQTLNGIEYIEFAPLNGGIEPIRKDRNNRPVISMNFFTFRDSIGTST